MSLRNHQHASISAQVTNKKLFLHFNHALIARLRHAAPLQTIGFLLPLERLNNHSRRQIGADRRNPACDRLRSNHPEIVADNATPIEMVMSKIVREATRTNTCPKYSTCSLRGPSFSIPRPILSVYSSSTSFINRGRFLTSRKILPRYSPSIPIASNWMPPRK